MHYYGFTEKLELFDFKDFAEYVSYLYTLETSQLVDIRRRLYKIKCVRSYIGSEVLFDREQIMSRILDGTEVLSDLLKYNEKIRSIYAKD